MIDLGIIMEEYYVIISLIPLALSFQKMFSLFGAVYAEDLLQLDVFITRLLQLSMDALQIPIQLL